MSRHVLRPRMPPTPDLAEEIEKYAKRKEAERGEGKEAGRPGEETTAGKPVNTRANINLADYIQVPGVKGIHGEEVVISKFEIPGANNMNYYDTHRFVLQQGLYIPTPAIFTPHFTNVVTTFHEIKALLDGNGNPIDRAEHEDIYKHLTTDHIAAYGAGTQGGAWASLNGKFVGGSGFNNLNLKTIIGIDGNGNLVTINKLLRRHTRRDRVLVDLAWSSQGLPRRESESGESNSSENIWFYGPKDGTVARFGADSGRAVLYCNGDPSVSDASLGTFACAENFSLGNTGGSK